MSAAYWGLEHPRQSQLKIRAWRRTRFGKRKGVRWADTRTHVADMKKLHSICSRAPPSGHMRRRYSIQLYRDGSACWVQPQPGMCGAPLNEAAFGQCKAHLSGRPRCRRLVYAVLKYAYMLAFSPADMLIYGATIVTVRIPFVISYCEILLKLRRVLNSNT